MLGFGVPVRERSGETMTRTSRALLAVVAALLSLPGCGSAPAASPSPKLPPAASADRLYADYLAALRAARSEHYAGTVAFSDGTSVSLDVTATQTTAHLLARSQGISVEEIVAGGRAFQRGGSHGPDWVVLPPEEARGAAALTMEREAECAAREHGTLHLGPRTRIGGRLVATLVDDGRGAGAAPQSSYLTLDAPVRLVRVVQTGPQSDGGSADCGHQPGPVAISAQVDYDRFDTPVRITPPPNPTDPNAQTA
ncbi:MAG: hypothetical protein JWL78_896 [Chloroflexi bacterium]|nr:hypothetical protein [Chloroflexota bacterium]